MANGFFPTGVSDKPIDITSGARYFGRAALEARLAEIEANKIQIGDNAKKLYEAMSLSTIEGMTEKMQLRYEDVLKEKRDSAWKAFRDSKGKPDPKKIIEIQRGFDSVAKQMALDKSLLEDARVVQDTVLNNQGEYVDTAVARDLSEVFDAIDNGEYAGRPLSLLAKHQVPIGVGEFMSKHYGESLKNLDIESLGDFEGNVFTQTETRGIGVDAERSRDKAIRLRDSILDNPWFKQKYVDEKGAIDWNKYNEQKALVEDRINRVIMESKPYRQSYSRGGGGSGSVNYTPTSTTIAGNTYDIVSTPTDVSQAERVVPIGAETGAINLTTGEQISEQRDVEITGVDVNKGVILARGKGAFRKKGDQVALEALDSRGSLGNRLSSRSEKDNLQRMATPADLNDKSKITGVVESTLRQENDNSKIQVKDVQLNPVEEREDTYIVSGTVKYLTKPDTWLTREKNLEREETFQYRFRKIPDPEAEAAYELPMRKNKPLLARWFGRVNINGVPIETYFNREPEQKKEDPLGIL